MTPDIVDLTTQQKLTIKRSKESINKKSQEIVPLIRKHKHRYMLWNVFLKNFHLEIMNRLNKKISTYLLKIP